MKSICKKIHLWLSLPFGVIIAIICLTGAILVFETKITEKLNRELFYVSKVDNRTLPIDQLVEKVNSTLPDSVEITALTIHADPERSYQANLSKPRRASILIDQYTGQIKGRSERTPFFTVVFKAHRWLLDSAKPDGGIFWGKLIVGVSTLLFVLVLISGVVIWLPRTAKGLKNRLKIVGNKGWKRFWYDLHVSGGIYATVLLLVMSLTGLTWSFSWYRTGFYNLFGVQTNKPHTPDSKAPKAERDDNREEKKEKQNPSANWGKVYAELARQNEGYAKISLSNSKATVTFDRWGNQRAADSYKIAPHSGEITQIDRYEDSSKATQLRGWVYTLHVGNWGGWFSKIITVIVSVIGGALPLTGYYLWIKRISRKKCRTNS